jgi:Ca-activated chloride channel family protein
MHGFPLETSKSLLRSMLPRLRPQDSFNVVFFAGSSFALSPDRSLPATTAHLQRALAAIDGQRGGGGTELMQALRTAYALPRADDRVARAVVVVTDGYVAVEAQAFKFVRERLNEASCFAFGIGASVNRGLIEALARAGQGEPFVVLAPDQAAAAAERLRVVVEQPVLSRLTYRFEGFEAREVAPMALPDLLAERPVVLFGKWRGEAKGRIVLRGHGANGLVETSIDVARSAPREENSPLRVLWARRWVEVLDDERHLAPAKELEEAITDLGLSYRLLTAFTSFVAVDSEVVNRTGPSQTVRQPLPLPEGVDDTAIGGTAQFAVAAKRAMPMPSTGPAYAASPPPAPAQGRVGAGAGGGATLDATKAGEEERTASAAVREEARREHPSMRVEIAAERSTGLADASALREAVRSALLRAATGCLAAGRYELRLVLDRAGKVVRVDVAGSPDPAARRCAEQALAGLAASPRPDAQGNATWSAVVTITR